MSAYSSKEAVLAQIKNTAIAPSTVYITPTFTTHDPRFVVITIKHTGSTGTVALFDSADGFATELSCQSMALDASGVTVLRYNAGTNGILRNQLRMKLTVSSGTVTVSSVNVTATA